MYDAAKLLFITIIIVIIIIFISSSLSVDFGSVW